MPNLPLDPIVLILTILVAIVSLFYLHEHSLRKRAQIEGEKALEEFREKGLETLNQSIQKSENIISGTEAEYAKKLQEIITISENDLAKSQSQLTQFLADLKRRGAEFDEASKTALQERINQLFTQLEDRLSNFLITTEQKTTSSIELELRSARNLIDTYRNQQMKAVDENIIAMLEQTLTIVLGKKMPLKDHVELVYEALEKAKLDNFVV